MSLYTKSHLVYIVDPSDVEGHNFKAYLDSKGDLEKLGLAKDTTNPAGFNDLAIDLVEKLEQVFPYKVVLGISDGVLQDNERLVLDGFIRNHNSHADLFERLLQIKRFVEEATQP